MRLRSLATWFAASALCVGLAPAASAVDNVAVVFGDSLPANPTPADYLAGKAGLPLPGTRVNPVGCGTDFAFSNAVGRGAGKEVRDYTCAGASYRTGGMHVTQQIDRAIANGDLNGETSEVVIMAGGNDTYPYILNDHMPVPQIAGQITDAVREAVAKVRAAAPNARVKTIGYPRISGPQGEVCLINVAPGLPAPTPGVDLKEIEAALEEAVRVGTEQSGGEFISLKPITEGHHMCTEDRWITGLVDTTAERHNIILHMTDHGLNQVGEAAGRA